MSHRHTCCLVHLVFVAEAHRPTIRDDIRERLLRLYRHCVLGYFQPLRDDPPGRFCFHVHYSGGRASLIVSTTSSIDVCCASCDISISRETSVNPSFSAI